MSIRTGMNRMALSLGRFAYKNGVTRKIYNGAAKVITDYAEPAISVLTPNNPYKIGMTRSLLLKEHGNKATKLQAGDFFHGILLNNDPPMEFYSRTSIPVYIHSPGPSIVGEQWKYQKKKTKEIMADVMKLANTLSVELTRREISFFKSYLLPLLPESFTGVVLRFPEENEAGIDRSSAKRLNDIRQSDEVKEYVLAGDLVKKINLLLSLNCPS